MVVNSSPHDNDISRQTLSLTVNHGIIVNASLMCPPPRRFDLDQRARLHNDPGRRVR